MLKIVFPCMRSRSAERYKDRVSYRGLVKHVLMLSIPVGRDYVILLQVLAFANQSSILRHAHLQCQRRQWEDPITLLHHPRLPVLPLYSLVVHKG